MLGSNGRQAVENIRQYILDHFTPEDYDGAPTPLGENGEFTMEQFPQVADFILTIMKREKTQAHYHTRQEMFTAWSEGLPPVLDTCYHYNRSALEDLTKILDGESDLMRCLGETFAQYKMDDLIFRELARGEQEYQPNQHNKAIE